MATFVRTQTIDHPIGNSGRLDLRVSSADVLVRGTAGGDAHVVANFEIHATSDEDADRIFEEVQLRVERREGMLVAEYPGDEPTLSSLVGRLFSGRGQVDLDVQVDMPAHAELRLDGVSGDVIVEGLTGEQRYNTVSGDASLTDIGGDVRINSVSGDVIMRANAPIAVRAETVSGDVSLVGPMIRELRASAVSGDVEVEGQLEAGHDYRIETVSGDVVFGLLGSATFEVRGIASDVSSALDHRIEGRQDRRRVVIGSGGPTVVFNSMSGDLAINRPRRLDRIVPQPPAAMPAAPPVPPAAAPAPTAPRPSADEQLDILRALERGDIDIEEANRRLTGASGNE